MTAQRTAALGEANRRWSAIGGFRREVAAVPYAEGCEKIAHLLRFPVEELDGVRLLRLLSMPRTVGATKAVGLLSTAQINPDRRLRELTDRERGLLAYGIMNRYALDLDPYVRRRSETVAAR